MTAVTLAPGTVGRWALVWEICGVTTVVLYSVILVPVKPVGGFVGWEPHSGRKHALILVWCKLLAY